MRIAFDLDGTLIPHPGSLMPLEPLHRLPCMLSPEPIRAGAPQLLRTLRRSGHDVWLYTTSLRNPTRLHLWFLSFGVRLGGVVNQTKHGAASARMRTTCSKFPPAFGIDLLVDDSAGVAMEGERHGFAVLRIAPHDDDWCSRVAFAVADRTRRVTAARHAMPHCNLNN